MKQSSISLIRRALTTSVILTSFLAIVFSLYAFSVKRITDDFLKQLGLSKTAADEKIVNSIFGGSVDAYGMTKAKNILVSDRAAVTKDLLAYIKVHIQTAPVKQQYEAIREKAKPKPKPLQTPEAMRSEYSAGVKKMIATSEAGLKKADATMKPVYEKMLVEGKKQLADAEDPNNEMFKSYEEGYPQLVKDMETQNKMQLEKWEAEYPADILQYVKPLLKEFLVVTENIDFNAALVDKKGKKVFVNPEYERKDGRWKMAFRAGKEVVTPARDFVEQWLTELK